jgi:NAD(P)H-dependent FMN reductase
MRFAADLVAETVGGRRDRAQPSGLFADGRPLDRFPDDTARVVGAIAEADVVLLASPVYRASFTGALKNLLDLTPVEALRAKPVGIVAMGATLHHYLGVDWQLRAVLAWFGALVVPTSGPPSPPLPGRQARRPAAAPASATWWRARRDGGLRS